MKRHLNTSYRLVWNHITGTLVVASELARSRGNAPVWRLLCLLLLSRQSRHWLLTRLYRLGKP
nr:ESPR domain-containing protein [Escherichia coli]